MITMPSKSSKPISSGRLNTSFAMRRRATTYLSALLPKGWQQVYVPLRAGSYFGLRISCPTCHVRPPQDLVGAQRWRWMSVHQQLEHKGG
jgi:hypothetical protein